MRSIYLVRKEKLWGGKKVDDGRQSTYCVGTFSLSHKLENNIK